MRPGSHRFRWRRSTTPIRCSRERTLDVEAPWRWYLEHPGRGLLTIALHTFNLTDQDLLFTYSRDLDPWYRVPLGIVNHAAVALGALGLVLLGCRARAARDSAGA